MAWVQHGWIPAGSSLPALIFDPLTGDSESVPKALTFLGGQHEKGKVPGPFGPG